MRKIDFLSQPATFANSFSVRGGSSLATSPVMVELGLFFLLLLVQPLCVQEFLCVAALSYLENAFMLHMSTTFGSYNLSSLLLR